MLSRELEQFLHYQKLVSIKGEAEIPTDMLFMHLFGCVSVSQRERDAHTLGNGNIQLELQDGDVGFLFRHSPVFLQPLIARSKRVCHLTQIQNRSLEWTIAPSFKTQRGNEVAKSCLIHLGVRPTI